MVPGGHFQPLQFCDLVIWSFLECCWFSFFPWAVYNFFRQKEQNNVCLCYFKAIKQCLHYSDWKTVVNFKCRRNLIIGQCSSKFLKINANTCFRYTFIYIFMYNRLFYIKKTNAYKALFHVCFSNSHVLEKSQIRSQCRMQTSAFFVVYNWKCSTAKQKNSITVLNHKNATNCVVCFDHSVCFKMYFRVCVYVCSFVMLRKC